MRWQKKLTKKQLAHVKKWGGGTLAEFKRNREAQHKMKENGEVRDPLRNNEPCWECRIIARKLGLEE